MEFLTGITPKETMELDMLVRPELAGSKVKVNGFVHAIRALGDVVFVVLRFGAFRKAGAGITDRGVVRTSGVG